MSKRSQKETKPPPRWPSELRYLRHVHYTSSFPASVLHDISGVGVPTNDQPNASHLVTIRKIENPKHPAFGQMGLFAAKKIPAHTHIVDYLGEVHADDRPQSNYDISLLRMRLNASDERSMDGNVETSAGEVINIGIDASRSGNEARFINDYRGVQPKPNAIFKERRTGNGELRMSVWTNAEVIKKGDEILVSYGKSWWRARGSVDVTQLVETIR